MFTALLIFHALIAILLIVVVLIQPGQGDSGAMLGGAGSTSAFGADTGAVLTKTTAVLGAIFVLNSLLLSIVGSKVAEPPSVVEKVATQKESK
ncbi:MAG: preprotein translocase subunit SecG [Desulfurobacterium sp.]|nr:MAG: preprotein translocase subunit SecG [Desulfurobacterium sp.]